MVKLTDKCSLPAKRTGRDRRFLMLQAALPGHEVWAASPGAASSVQVGRNHWIRTGRWVKLDCLMCKHDPVQSPPHQRGEALGFLVTVLPPIHSQFSTALPQAVFMSCPRSAHSLLSSRHNSSLFTLHQSEGYQWVTVETASELFPAWCSCEHAWGTLC